MPLVPLDFPPGVFKNGTKYEAKGRWFDTNLVRWVEGTLQPVGGWQKVQAAASDIDLNGPVQGMFAWQNNAGQPWLAMGQKDACWAFTEGALTDITPSGLTSGQDDATTSSDAYGDGAYGTGSYGTGDQSQSTITPAQTWQFDNFGERLVAVARSDGTLYDWGLNTSNNLAAVSNAPSDNEAVVVTPERFLVALGAGGDGRKVQWADQESLSTWSATATNQAGDFILPGTGQILLGRRARGETLIWTSSDLFAMRYIGGALIYSFQQVGSDCGPISPRSVAMVDGGRAFWMGAEGFFAYDGFTQPIPSEVSDYVFNDLNRLQASKIHAVAQPAFSEVWWYYPSSGSSDVDRYVFYNYVDSYWGVGKLNRTAGVPRGVFRFPMATDKNGAVYDHERGQEYDDVSGEVIIPFAVSGPFEIGQGDRRAVIRGMLPDEDTLGDMSAKLIVQEYPTDAERSVGPFDPSERTDIRASGRQVQLRLDHVTVDGLLTESDEGLIAEDGTPLLWSEFDPANWRFGVPRLDVVPGSRR